MHTTASNVTRPESLLGRTHVIPAIITHILRNYRALLNKPSRNAPIYIQVASLSSSNMQGTILPVSSFKKINRVAQSQRAEVDSRVQLRVHACQAPGLPGGGTAPRPQEGPHPGGLSCCVDEGWEGGRFPSRPLPGPSWELPGGRPSRGAAEAQICEVLCTEGGTENMGLCVGGTVEHKESPCLQAKDISQLRFRSPCADSEARTG